MADDLVQEAARRYYTDAAFHARVHRAARMARDAGWDDPVVMAAALGVVMADRDPATGDPSPPPGRLFVSFAHTRGFGNAILDPAVPPTNIDEVRALQGHVVRSHEVGGGFAIDPLILWWAVMDNGDDAKADTGG